MGYTEPCYKQRNNLIFIKDREKNKLTHTELLLLDIIHRFSDTNNTCSLSNIELSRFLKKSKSHTERCLYSLRNNDYVNTIIMNGKRIIHIITNNYVKSSFYDYANTDSKVFEIPHIKRIDKNKNNYVKSSNNDDPNHKNDYANTHNQINENNHLMNKENIDIHDDDLTSEKKEQYNNIYLNNNNKYSKEHFLEKRLLSLEEEIKELKEIIIRLATTETPPKPKTKKDKKTKEVETKIQREIEVEFIPPTIEQVQEYLVSDTVKTHIQKSKTSPLTEQEVYLTAHDFIEHWNKHEWKRFNEKKKIAEPVKCWKGCVRTWISNGIKWGTIKINNNQQKTLFSSQSSSNHPIKPYVPPPKPKELTPAEMEQNKRNIQKAKQSLIQKGVLRPDDATTTQKPPEAFRESKPSNIKDMDSLKTAISLIGRGIE